MKSPKEVHLSFNRKNLTYRVQLKQTKSKNYETLVTMIKRFKNQTGIIYCLSRKNCQEVSDELNKRLNLGKLRKFSLFWTMLFILLTEF